MSELLINHFLAELDRVKKFSGSLSESTVREAFKDLLKAWSRQNRKFYYSDKVLSDRLTDWHFKLFGLALSKENKSLSISGTSSAKPFQTLAISGLVDYEAIEKSNLLARYRYTSEGERLDNITDWGLKSFEAKYGKGKVTKDDIFVYCYGVLHDPLYRETYALNLKRDFPRVPLYDDFQPWRDWGQRLLDLHIGYESAAPFAFAREDTPDDKARTAGVSPRVILNPTRKRAR